MLEIQHRAVFRGKVEIELAIRKLWLSQENMEDGDFQRLLVITQLALNLVITSR